MRIEIKIIEKQQTSEQPVFGFQQAAYEVNELRLLSIQRCKLIVIG